jgi:outer membrane protein assembly factor BamB
VQGDVLRIMRWLPQIIPTILVLAAGTAAVLWWRTGVASVTARIPGADHPPGLANMRTIDMAGQVITGTGKPGEGTGEWAQFRGTGTGRSTETGLLKDPAQAKILWTVDLGEGYAGPVVRKGCVYILDYSDSADVLRCLSTETGQEIWRHAYKVDTKRNHGMSRTIPAVDDSVAVTLGPQCQVVAVNCDDGRFLWGKDLVRDYGSKVPPWYAGQCPLLRDGRVYIAPAGDKVLLTALDAKTGAVLWEVPNDLQWKMTHSSIVEVALEDRPTLVYCGSGGAIGVEESSGKILWQSTDWKISIATVPSPVDLGGGRILFTGGYGSGAMIGRVEKSGDTYALRVEKRMDPAVLGSEQQTPVLLADGSGVMAVIPSGEMVFMNMDGSIRWHSGGGNRYGSGAYLVADGAAYVINDTGTLSAVAAGPGGFQLFGSATIIRGGSECWGPMALADGRLYLRDFTHLVCLDLRAK